MWVTFREEGRGGEGREGKEKGGKERGGEWKRGKEDVVKISILPQ
jgi:hypothetical protein